MGGGASGTGNWGGPAPGRLMMIMNGRGEWENAAACIVHDLIVNVSQ